MPALGARIAAAAALAAALASGAPPGAALAAGAEPDERAARIAELDAAIARDEETLRRLVEREAREGEAPLHEHPVLREISRRLPRLQAERRRLQHEAAAEPVAPPSPSSSSPSAPEEPGRP
jgi:hypothetical protein